MLDIYNPFQYLSSLSEKILSDFWFRTGSPSYLVRLLAHFDENLNELTGEFYPTSSFIDYKADTEAPLPMICKWLSHHYVGTWIPILISLIFQTMK